MTNQHLMLPADIQQVRRACDFVADLAKQLGMSDHDVFGCELAVEEAFSNIVEHGYRYQDGIIIIHCDPQPQHLIIRIVDEAPPFNPLKTSSPKPSASLWERTPGGWGVFFMKQYMDRIEYEYQSNRNILTLTKEVG